MGSKEEIKEKILQLKREKNAVIFAHNYQREEIQELADFVGDSLELSLQAREVEADIIVFCAVSFMAETAKILAPDKLVLLPRKDARCPMASQVTAEEVRLLRRSYPDAKVVCYVNTTAEVKAESDVCCTSGNAQRIVETLSAEKAIFLPDRNLAHHIQRGTRKTVIPWGGYCYLHERFTKKEVEKARALYPGSVLVVHPECVPEVVELADEVKGTGGMVRLAREREARVFLVGTEEGLIRRLRRENPGKMFFSPGKALMCSMMKKTTLKCVYKALSLERYKVELPEDVSVRARRALEEMINCA